MVLILPMLSLECVWLSEGAGDNSERKASQVNREILSHR